MSSFAQGFGMGTQMWNQAVQNNRLDAEAERQASLDKMRSEEHDKRMTMLDGQIGDAQLLRDQAAERNKAGQDVVATEGAAVVGPDGKAYMQPDAEVAKAALEQARAEGDETQYTTEKAGIVKAGGAGSKTFLAADGGLDSAKTYAGSQNTFDAKADRVAAIMEKQNFGSAMEFRTKVDAHKVATYDANLKVLTRSALDTISKEGPMGLEKWYEHYQDGHTAKATVNPDGSGTISAFDKNGKQAGVISFKNNDDLALQVTRKINPEQAVASYAAQLAEAAKESRKTHVLAPGGSLVDGSGKVVATSDVEDPRVTAARIKQEGGSGSTKMDEENKLVFKDSARRVDEAERYQREAMLKVQPGEDPEKNPAVIESRKALATAKINHYKTSINLGMITPVAVANQVIGAAKNSAEVMRSLNELGQSVGTDFTDQVSDLISQTDAWKLMTESAKSTPSTAASTATPKMTPQQLAGAAPAYSPPKNSPAGVSAERRAAAAARETTQASANQAKAATLRQKAASMLGVSDKDSRMLAAAELQSDPAFAYLDLETKAKIYSAVNGR